MKKLLPLFAFMIVLFGCKKSALDNTNETLPTGTTIRSGSFLNGTHTTTGLAKIVNDGNGKTHLVIENLRTDNGPDLRIWLSPNNNESPYQEVGLLKAVTGNFSYELTSTINYTSNDRVLIWCEDFSVLFGYAILQ